MKKFTLIELFIIIIVITLLSGLLIPKFIDIKRDALIANLYNDIDTLSKAITMYNTYENSLPLAEKVIINDQNLASYITSIGDSLDSLYKIDINKTKKYHTKLKTKVNNECYFIYSTLSGNIYYTKGLVNKKGNIVFGIGNVDIISDVKLGEILLDENKINIVNSQNVFLTGKLIQNKDVEIILNKQPISVTYENIVYSYLLININAGQKYKTFKAELKLNEGINELKIKSDKIEKNYKIKKVIYVDAIKGNDNGDGTKNNPFKTFNKAFSVVNNGDLIYLSEGTYYFTNANYSYKNFDVVGQQKKTTLIFNTPYKRFYEYPANGYFTINSNVNFYDLIIETRGSNTFAHYFYNTGQVGFYNVVFNNMFDLDYADFLNFEGGQLKFINITLTNSGSKNDFIRQLSTSQNTVIFENCYGNIKVSPLSNNNINFVTSIITNDPLLDQNFNILSSGWKNAGTGTNPDGSKAHIGVYGGQYAWK